MSFPYKHMWIYLYKQYRGTWFHEDIILQCEQDYFRQSYAWKKESQCRSRIQRRLELWRRQWKSKVRLVLETIWKCNFLNWTIGWKGWRKRKSTWLWDSEYWVPGRMVLLESQVAGLASLCLCQVQSINTTWSVSSAVLTKILCSDVFIVISLYLFLGTQMRQNYLSKKPPDFPFRAPVRCTLFHVYLSAFPCCFAIIWLSMSIFFSRWWKPWREGWALTNLCTFGARILAWHTIRS